MVMILLYTEYTFSILLDLFVSIGDYHKMNAKIGAYIIKQFYPFSVSQITCGISNIKSRTFWGHWERADSTKNTEDRSGTRATSPVMIVTKTDHN